MQYHFRGVRDPLGLSDNQLEEIENVYLYRTRIDSERSLSEGPMATEIILLFAAIILVAGSLGLLIARLTNPRLKGLGFLGCAFASGGIGAGLLLTIGRASPLISMLMADLFVLLAFVLLHVAVLELLERDSLFPVLGSVVLTLQVAFELYLIYGRGGAVPLRVIAVGLFIAVQTAQTTRLLWRVAHDSIRIPALFTAIILGFFTFWNVVRSVVSMLGLLDAQQVFYRVEVATFTMYVGVALGLAFGIFWMTTSKLSAGLEQMASTDPLTRIFNRRSFLLWCEKEEARNRETGALFSILMIDLDHFKQVNDNFGHQTGDKALCLAVERIQDSIRGIDVLGRWGGEEFAVLLPSASAEAALIVGERVRANIERTPLRLPSHGLRGQTGVVRLTASVGIATYRAPVDRINDMLQRADEALYKAKASGRNRVERDGVPSTKIQAQHRVAPQGI
jgi:diguanylate cyclase (GGDEF)-like protein